MLCLSVLWSSLDHFNHMCSIKGKIATTYILSHEAYILPHHIFYDLYIAIIGKIDSIFSI